MAGWEGLLSASKVTEGVGGSSMTATTESGVPSGIGFVGYRV